MKKGWKLNLLTAAASVGFILIVLEVTVRGYDVVQGAGFFSGRRNQVADHFDTVRPFRTFGHDLYEMVNGERFISSTHDELFPIKKKKGAFRIVAFGGSTTVNQHAYEEEGIHYPLIVQEKLRKAFNRDDIEVINVANSAYSTPHSLILLELDVISWKPDLVILSHNTNDLSASYWPNFTYDYSNKYSHKFYATPDYESVYTIPNILFQHSELYWFIRERVKTTLESTSRFRRESLGMEPLPAAREVFERNLLTFAAIAKANKIPIIFGSQPLEPSDEFFLKIKKYKPYNDKVIWPLQDEFVNHHRTYNMVIEKTAKETGAMFIDNNAMFGGKREYFYNYVHYLPVGVRKLGEQYADFIIKNAKKINLK